MTQRSRPQPESTVTAATYLDSGPYSGDQWAQRCALNTTGDEDTISERTQLRGVVPTVWDKLCVTNPAGKTMEIGQGSIWVRGHLLIHDDLGPAVPLQFNPTTPANIRTDRIVAVQNNMNGVYGTNLEFPTNLTDYNALNSVPAYCLRLAILTGVVGGAMRSLVQTGSYWMIEIARYTINNAGNITAGPTDYREFAQIEHIVGVHSDDDATMKDALIIGAQVDDAAGSATNFGVAIMARLEDSIGTMRDVARIAIRYTNTVLATLTSRYELWLTHETTDILAGVVVGPDMDIGYVDGNARGDGAVEWQTYRNAAIQVASGEYSVVSGGQRNEASGSNAVVSGGRNNVASDSYTVVGGGDANVASTTFGTVGGGIQNTASGNRSTVGGGFSNDASGDYSVVSGGDDNTASGTHSTVSGGDSNIASAQLSVIPGGLQAVADKYGQCVHASGRFAADGDAQGTIQMVIRDLVTFAAAGVWHSLALDGAASFVTIANDTVWTFHILVVGTTQGGGAGMDIGSYSIVGCIENDNGTTTLKCSTVTTHCEDDANWDVRVSANDVSDTLMVQVNDSGASGAVVRWVATIRLAEVSFG